MNADDRGAFLDRFRGMTDDELVEIFMQRESLADEARSAIDSVVRERGIEIETDIDEIST
jgi:hypothetical protein